jgi:putative ABC transport system permease protein
MSAYRVLLRAFPRSFRERFGADMEAVFTSRLAEGTSVGARARIWVRALMDVMRHAPAERLAALRGGSGVRPAGRGFRLGEGMRDVRYGVRALVRAPLFTVVGVLTLALGIGANTAVFSVVHALLLQPLPYEEPDRLVYVWPERSSFNTAMVGRVDEAVPSLEGVAGLSLWAMTLVEDGAEPIEVETAFVSANYFDVLGAHPLLGRTFEAADAEPSRAGVAILSYELWQRRYGGDPAVVGQTIGLADADHAIREVIGVMPRGHRPLEGSPLAWTPLPDHGTPVRTDASWWVHARVGRLAAGATRAQAEAGLRTIAIALRAEAPNVIQEEDVRAPTLPPLREHEVGSIRSALLVLTGAVALVLLIACVNVANLMLARGEARGREVAVRGALGASRYRIVRQLMTEALLLALAGAAAGVLLAHALLRGIVARAPASIADMSAVGLGSPVLVFALAASLASAVVFGVLPAFRLGGAATGNAVREGRMGAVGVRASGRATSALVTLEVALAVILVAGAGLMARTLSNLYAVPRGFDSAGVLALRPNPPHTRYLDVPSYRDFYEQALARIRTLPDVASAAGIQNLHLTTQDWSFPMYIEGHALVDVASPPLHSLRVVTPDYFATLRIPLVRGRVIEEGDRAGRQLVAVVNRAFAERYWPGTDPVGRELRTFTSTGPPITVVGVVGDVRQFALNRAPEPEVYIPHAQLAWKAPLWLVVRSRTGDPVRLGPSIRDAISAVDAQVPVSQVQTFAAVIDDSAATTRFLTLLLGFFGASALILGAIGVYGVTAFTVARRVPEFSVRLALGARGRDVLGVALARALGPIVIGIALGLAGAFASTRLLRGMLFEVGATDPVTFIAVAALLALVGVMAVLAPASRAARVQPAAVLRQE